jgi:hypothetical protein
MNNTFLVSFFLTLVVALQLFELVMIKLFLLKSFDVILLLYFYDLVTYFHYLSTFCFPFSFEINLYLFKVL